MTQQSSKRLLTSRQILCRTQCKMVKLFQFFCLLRVCQHVAWISDCCTKHIGLGLLHLVKGSCWKKCGCFVILSFPASQGKNKGLICSSGDSWSKGKQEENSVVSHFLYFCTAKGRNGPVVWPEGINFESCTAVKLPGSWKEVFQASDPDSCHGGWEWRCSGQASLSTLGAEVSCFKPWWLRMLVLAEFVISVGSAEMKGELKEKPTRGQQGKMLARNIFLSLFSQRLLATWVHISSSKGSSEKKWRKEAC